MTRKLKVLENIIEIFNNDDRINEKEIEELKDNIIYIVDNQWDEVYLLHLIESIILTVIFAIIANCNIFVEIHLFLCKHYEWLNGRWIFLLKVIRC